MFTVLGYRMSYLEFIGTLLTLWSVWLVARKSIWTWPIGNVASILFAVLFFQIRLYSDLIEQMYYLATNCYGWWLWIRMQKGFDQNNPEGIARSSRRSNAISIAVTATGTLVMGAVMSRVHLWWPALFKDPAAFPYLDAWTTVMSFVAQILMAHKKVECWILWIIVDVVGIGLYWAQGVIFVSLLYAIFLVLAVQGLLTWRRTLLQRERAA